jgi:hypothetical protein
MAVNTIVLIIVTVMAGLVLASACAFVVLKTRIKTRNIGSPTHQDRIDQEVLELRRQEELAADSEARAHAAQVEIDIKTDRAGSLQQQATDRRSEAVTARDHLNELKGQLGKPTASAAPPTRNAG